MKIFDLRCGKGHVFEGWFEDADAFEEQAEKSLVECPVCSDKSVVRTPSTFAIKSSASTPASHDMPQEMEVLKKVSDYINSNFDDVGCDFAKEALKIHYGVSEPRNIRGNSTEQEEETLKEEGIPFVKIPVAAPPDSDSDS